MIVHGATIGSYVLQDGDLIGLAFFAFIASLVLGFLLVRGS